MAIDTATRWVFGKIKRHNQAEAALFSEHLAQGLSDLDAENPYRQRQGVNRHVVCQPQAPGHEHP